MVRALLLLVVAAANPLLAQSRGQAVDAPRSSSADLRQSWTEVSAFLARSAAAVPDSSYGYKPVPTVRSFGQLIAHVADAQRMFCAISVGEQPPPEGTLEKTLKTKAELVKALDESTAYCKRAYALPQSRLSETVDLFGQRRRREFALLMNVTHDYEHYGNAVTYLRMLGMVPPSSQPAP